MMLNVLERLATVSGALILAADTGGKKEIWPHNYTQQRTNDRETRDLALRLQYKHQAGTTPTKRPAM